MDFFNCCAVLYSHGGHGVTILVEGNRNYVNYECVETAVFNPGTEHTGPRQLIYSCLVSVRNSVTSSIQTDAQIIVYIQLFYK